MNGAMLLLLSQLVVPSGHRMSSDQGDVSINRGLKAANSWSGALGRDVHVSLAAHNYPSLSESLAHGVIVWRLLSYYTVVPVYFSVSDTP